MKKIEMVDLRSQYERLKPQIDEAIERVINSTQFVKGPEVNSFQLELFMADNKSKMVDTYDANYITVYTVYSKEFTNKMNITTL